MPKTGGSGAGKRLEEKKGRGGGGFRGCLAGWEPFFLAGWDSFFLELHLMAIFKVLYVAALIVAVAASGDDGHEDHGHDEHGDEEHAWEWAGTFILVKDKPYTWIMSKKDGAYAYSAMKFAMVPTTTNDKAGLEAAEEETAETLFAGNDTDVTDGTLLAPSTLYNLNLNDNAFMSTFKIEVSSTATYAIFAEHFPTEFEDKYHFLKNADGGDVEPGAVEPDAETAASSNMAPVGTAFLASFLSAMAAFTGVIMLVPMANEYISQSKAGAFASGALLAAALFLMWPESLHLIPVNMSSKEEADVAGVFGACILAGFVTTIMVQWTITLITGSSHSHASPTTNVVVASKNVEDTLEGGEKPAGASTDEPPKVVDWTLVGGVVLGDFFHNFVDGVVIGASFKQCDTSVAWGVAASTIAHEVSQELGDFLLLTKQGGLSIPKALGVNFASALSCILGTVLVYATDPNDSSIGCLLAYGGGCYMYIATVPVFHQVVDQVTAKDMVVHFLIFFFGALCIGLVLLDHEHCGPPGVDPHAGHGH
jgi:zinc transporter ZupT